MVLVLSNFLYILNLNNRVPSNEVVTIIYEVGTIMYDISTINVRFYILEILYSHGYNIYILYHPIIFLKFDYAHKL